MSTTDSNPGRIQLADKTKNSKTGSNFEPAFAFDTIIISLIVFLTAYSDIKKENDKERIPFQYKGLSGAIKVNLSPPEGGGERGVKE